MPMQAESLQVLESASVAPAQARAIVRAIEIEIAGAQYTLATKHDVLALHHGSDVLRAEMRSDLATLAAQLRAEMAQLASDLRVEMAEQFAGVRKEISGVTRQMYVALLGQTAVFLGFFYFFIAELR